jgi:hypothetical protein
MKCRKLYIDDGQNRGVIVTAGQAPTIPVYGRSGIRHERWPELAMRQLNGTWEPETPMQTEKPQVGQNHEGESTDAEFRDGLPCSSDEAE